MKSSRQIEKIVGRAQAKAGRVTDERILTDARVALTNSSHNRPQASRPGPSIWRFIMESKITRYSTAAVVTLAAALVLLGPFGTSKNGGIVLADVAEKVSEMGNSVLRGRRTLWYQGQEEPCLKANGVAYVSSQYGYMEEQHDADGNLIHRAYILEQSRRFVLVIPSEKRYMEVPVSEEIFDRLMAVLTPGGLITCITSSPHTELGRKHFNGLEAEGFETNDHQIFDVPGGLQFLLPVNSLTARVWIDVDASLPAGFEIDFTTDRALGTGFKKLRAEFRVHDIQWNAEIPAGIFDPNIPDDYTEFKITDFIPAEAKAGLVGLVAIPAGFVFWKRQRRKRAKANRHG